MLCLSGSGMGHISFSLLCAFQRKEGVKLKRIDENMALSSNYMQFSVRVLNKIFKLPVPSFKNRDVYVQHSGVFFLTSKTEENPFSFATF